MKLKRILTTVVLAALLGVTVLCALTAYGTYAWFQANGARLRVFNRANVSAQAEETLNLEARSSFELISDAGDISVQAAPVEQFQITMRKSTWGANRDEAEALVEAMHVNVETMPDAIRLVYQQPETIDIIGSRVDADRVDFTILVPAQTAVKLETRFGEISVDGISAEVEVEAHFHSVSVSGLRGSVIIHNTNGDIHLSDIRAGEQDVRVETAFGAISVDGLSGRAISLDTSNGVLNAKQLNASGDLRLENSFGEISLDDFSAQSLTANSQNGEISLQRGQLEGALVAETTFAGITLAQVQAEGYTLHAQNGDVRLEGGQGWIDIQNQFGSIEVLNAQDAILKLISNNGSVVFTGSLSADQNQAIETSFGDVRLTIPDESAFQVTLETSFGSISTDLPLSVQGQVSEDRWQGTLNGGGPLLDVRTQNGDIRLEALTP